MKTTLFNSFVFAVFLFAPLFVSANITINEVAWMGTSESANDEWIELYNDGEESVTFDGWILDAVDGSPLIKLSGAILGKSFYILERSDDLSLPTVVADLIYTGALSNEGEHLRLKNAQGEVVHETDAKSGWLGGDNVTKDTMQWSDASWITGVPTPKAVNSILQDQEEDSSGLQTDELVESSSSGGGGGFVFVTPSVHLSPLPLSDVGETRNLLVSAGTKRITTTNQDLPFYALIFDKKGERVHGGNFEWSFGDGGSAFSEEAFHSYYYPGTYVVSLNVRLNDKEAVARTEVVVVHPDIKVTSLGKEGEMTLVEVKNNSEYDLNMYKWRLEGDSSKPFIFPKDTIIKAGELIIFPQEVTGVLTVTTARFLNQKGEEVSSFKKEETKEPEEIEVVKVTLPKVVAVVVPTPRASLVPLATTVVEQNKEREEEIEEIKEDTSKITGQGALVSESFTVEKPQGPFRKLLVFPKWLVRSIGNLF